MPGARTLTQSSPGVPWHDTNLHDLTLSMIVQFTAKHEQGMNDAAYSCTYMQNNSSLWLCETVCYGKTMNCMYSGCSYLHTVVCWELGRSLG